MSQSDQYFDSANDLLDLNRRTARGGMITMSAQVIRVILQTVSTMVLARLLLPEDFGLVGMVTVLMQLPLLFRDFGLTQATVQRLSITREQISNLFWFNIFMSVFMAAVFAMSAPLISHFYKRPELTMVTIALAVGIFVDGAGLQHRALMIRKMEFGKLATADIFSQLFAMAIAIIIGVEHGGYWALVVLNVAGSLFRTVFYSISTRWIPSAPKRNVGMKPFVSFGSSLFGFNLVNYFARNADSVIIGRFSGAMDLGFYGNACRLITLPMSQITGPINQVFTTTLSKLQDQPARFAQTYYKFMLVLCMMTMPAVMWVVATADNLVPILLGPGWVKTTLFLQAMALAALATALDISGGIVLISTGRSDKLLLLGICNSIIVVSGFLVGAYCMGAIGVALSMSITYPIILVYTWYFAFKDTQIRVSGMVKTVMMPTLISLTAALSSYLFILHIYDSGNHVINITIQTIIFVAIYGGAILAVPSLRQLIVDTFRGFFHPQDSHG